MKKTNIAVLLFVFISSAELLSGQEDPLIRMLEGYTFHQARLEIIPAHYWAHKYAEYLGLSDAQKKTILETSPRFQTYMDQWQQLQHQRDSYRSVMRLLDLNQAHTFRNLYFVELPLFEQLIVPSIQRYLDLSDTQKDQIKELYMGISKNIKKQSGTEYAFEADESIRIQEQEKSGELMWNLLTAEQKRRIDARKNAVLKK